MSKKGFLEICELGPKFVATRIRAGLTEEGGPPRRLRSKCLLPFHTLGVQAQIIQ